MRSDHRQRGFTLIELCIVLVVIGIMLGIGIPAYHSLASSQASLGAAQTVAFQLRLGRMRAQATGVPQSVAFDKVVTPSTVTISGGSSSSRWTLPRGANFAAGSADSFVYTPDGRASASSYVLLQSSSGHVDTVSVQTSGLVLVH